MAPVAFSFVVRFSSEDAIFKAENLCKGKADAMGTWKCAKEDTNCGRMEAEFQLEKASYISHIDIGNCGSAFIEILVGNSMWPQDKPFLTLLPSAMLMNPVDCKQWNKTHSVRMFNQSAFSKEAGSQWDRLRVICRQPFRKDKQFGLSFIRVRSVGDDDTPPSPEGVCGKTATSPSIQSLNDEDDEDGITRLKKASGLMGCIRSLEKGSPESPLNRAGRMLQAALDGRSPTTPANRPRNKSSSSPEMLSSPESPFGKRNCQPHSEGPKEKRNKPDRKWSLVGDIQDEVTLFLEDIDFTKIDLQNVTFKDLRDQMEAQRGCSLTKQEKKVFLQMSKAAIAKAMPPIDDSDQEDAMEISVNEQDASPSVTKTKEPNRTRKKARESKTSNSETERKTPSSKARSPPLTATTSISIDDDTEDLPSMLHSSQDNKPSRKEKEFYRTNGDFQPSPVREKAKEPNRTRKKARESSSKTSNSERKTPSSKTRGRPLPLDIFDVDVPSASTSLSIDDDDTEDLPSMLHSSQDNKTSRKEKEFYRTSGDFQPLPPHPPIRKKSSEPMVECPICSKFFSASDVEFHAAMCTNEASCTPYVPAPEPDTSGDYKPSPVKKTSSEPMVECPICNQLFPAPDVEFHAALCTNEAGCTPYVPVPEPEESVSFPIAI